MQMPPPKEAKEEATSPKLCCCTPYTELELYAKIVGDRHVPAVLLPFGTNKEHH